jgi:hypothetical protein
MQVGTGFVHRCHSPDRYILRVIPEASQRLSGTAGSAELAAVPALRFATAGMTGKERP